MAPKTFAQLEQRPAHRSFWYERLRGIAGTQSLEDWLIEQANARDFHGAYLAQPRGHSPWPGLTLEEIVTGLLSPSSTVDARALKLIVRMLQSPRLSPRRLVWWAMRERADVGLRWVIDLIPPQERNPHVDAIDAALGRPRGYAPVRYQYDPSRLVRRKATREDLWRTKRN